MSKLETLRIDWKVDLVTRDLKKDEGFRSRPYRDTEGLLTIGYGTLLENGISAEEAELLLIHRVKIILEELDSKVPIELPPTVQLAVANMAYNLGVPRLLGFKKMWKAIAIKDYETAAKEALDSKWARQVGSRAERIAEMIRRGADGI